MRKLLAMLTALALLLSVAPVSVMAEERAEERAEVQTLYVGSVNALETPAGDGWSFDAETGVLTLNNCTLTESMVHAETDEYGTYYYDAMIYYRGDLTIELIGTNSIEREITQAPTDYVSYYAILAGVYPKIVEGETWDEPSKLSIGGNGCLTVGIAFPAEARDWEYLEFSSTIACSAEGGADLSGLYGGGVLEVYGGMHGVRRPWRVKAFNNAPTFGDNAIVTAYEDVDGLYENANGYNWNNNDAWRMIVRTDSVALKSSGLLILLDSAPANGKGWTWENKVLTLQSDTEVKAVEFRAYLESAKLVLEGSVTLDSTAMGYDADWNMIPAIRTSCDLVINTAGHALTLTGEGNGINAVDSDLLISDSLVHTVLGYGAFSVYDRGGDVTIRNSTLRTDCTEGNEDNVSGELVLDRNYESEDEYNGNLLVENSTLDMIAGICTNNGNLTVKNSTVNMTLGYQGIQCYRADMFFQNSDITITGTGTLLDASYGEIRFDGCNLDLTGGEGRPLMLAARYYSYYVDDPEAGERNRGEPDYNAIRFVNMRITTPGSVKVGYEETVNSSYIAGHMILKDSADALVTVLKAAAVTPPQVKYRSISLMGNIAINFYMELPEWLRTDEGAFVQFTLEDGEVRKIPVSEGVETVVNGETVYIFSCAVNAMEMADEVLCQVFYAGGFSGEYRYSVQAYAKGIIGRTGNGKLDALLTAMLHYGAASQLHFGHNVENLANAGLSTPDYSTVRIEGFDYVENQGTELVKLLHTSLLLESETVLRLFFRADSSVERFTVSYQGQELTLTPREDMYYADVTGIVAKDLDEDVTVTVSDGVSSADVTFNPMTYCMSVQDDTTGTFSEQMKNLVAALYLYNQAANRYFGEN